VTVDYFYVLNSAEPFGRLNLGTSGRRCTTYARSREIIASLPTEIAQSIGLLPSSSLIFGSAPHASKQSGCTIYVIFKRSIMQGCQAALTSKIYLRTLFY
jgi:hypothetical protein